MEKYEQAILKNFMNMPYPELLGHKFEIDSDFLAGYISRFLSGERFDCDFNPFTKEEAQYINQIITENIMNEKGHDLLTYYLMVKLATNILNKYRL